jgi:hypothetical protein
MGKHCFVSFCGRFQIRSVRFDCVTIRHCVYKLIVRIRCVVDCRCFGIVTRIEIYSFYIFGGVVGGGYCTRSGGESIGFVLSNRNGEGGRGKGREWMEKK